MTIHPTAIVAPEARIAASAEIGPFCVIAAGVEIGERTVVESHARLGSAFGRVRIGADNLIQCGAVLGGPPQDYSYRTAQTNLEIGDHNRIGEFVTISLGTPKGGGTTRLGNHNFVMAYAHLGHDCDLQDHIVIVNGTQVAGHVQIGHHAVLSGMVGITQFVRIGAYAFLAGGATVNKDVPPYTIAQGRWATVRAVNKVGLKRAGFDPATRKDIDTAVRLLMDRSLTIADVIAGIEAECAASEAIADFVVFLRASTRGVARP